MEEAPKRGREDKEAVDGSAKRARVDVVASAESSSTVSNAGAAAAPLAAPAAAAAAVAHAKRLSNYGNADGKLRLCLKPHHRLKQSAKHRPPPLWSQHLVA